MSDPCDTRGEQRPSLEEVGRAWAAPWKQSSTQSWRELSLSPLGGGHQFMRQCSVSNVQGAKRPTGQVRAFITDTRSQALTWLLGIGRWFYQLAMVAATSKGNLRPRADQPKVRVRKRNMSLQGKFLEHSTSFKGLQPQGLHSKILNFNQISVSDTFHRGQLRK